MTFNIIGTGNMAWFLATRLTTAGHICKAVFGRDIEKARSLAIAVKADKYEDLANGVPDDADYCIIAATDTAIETIASQLSISNGVLLHTAGSIGINISNEIAHRAVLWPIYSIVKNSLPAHRQIPVIWEASTPKAKQAALEIAAALTDTVFEADEEKRAVLHLTAVFSNNFANHIMAIAEQVCKEHNVPFSLLYPIILQTAERIKDQSPAQIQTGPAKRGDNNTIKKHIQLLNSHNEWQKVYESITSSIKNMYKSDKG